MLDSAGTLTLDYSAEGVTRGTVCGAYRVLWWTVDLGPVDRRTFDLQESVEELLEAIEIFSGDLSQNKSNITLNNHTSQGQTPKIKPVHLLTEER